MILFCAAHLAAALANELEDDVIDAEARHLWIEYPKALEQLIRLAGDTKSPQENIWQISRAIQAIYPPEGRPQA